MAVSKIGKAYNAGVSSAVQTVNSYDGQYYGQITINHGLGVVPSAIVVTPQNSDGSLPVNYPKGLEVIDSLTTNTSFLVRVWSNTNGREFRINWVAFK